MSKETFQATAQNTQYSQNTTLEGIENIEHTTNALEGNACQAKEEAIENMFIPVFSDVGTYAQNTQNPQNAEKYEWEEMTRLDDVDELPCIDPQLVPPVLRNFVLECSNHFQTAFEMPLFCALSCLATAVQGKYQIELKEGYAEPLNLYTIITAEPSELKSPTLKAFKKPLEEWEEERNVLEKEKIREIISENKTFEKLIDSKRSKAGRIKDIGALKELSQEIIMLERELVEVPHYTRLFADDVTPESLGVILENQEGKLTIAEAEGGFFSILAGRYSKGVPNLDLILKAYNGENVRIDRKGFEPICIKNPTLTLLFLIQPYLLTNRENSEAFKGRGLDARFLYVIPRSKVGYRLFKNDSINKAHAQAYNNVIKGFLDMTLVSKEQHVLFMTEEAFKLYTDFMETLEKAMREGNELEGMRDWAGKKGTLARLAGLLHCATFSVPHKEFLGLDTMQNACAIMTCLIAHAKRAYGLMFDNEELQTAKKILTWITNTKNNCFSARDCFQGVRGKIKKQSEVNKGLEILEEHAYIRKLPMLVQKTAGRPPSMRYEVNPFFRK